MCACTGRRKGMAVDRYLSVKVLRSFLPYRLKPKSPMQREVMVEMKRTAVTDESVKLPPVGHMLAVNMCDRASARARSGRVFVHVNTKNVHRAIRPALFAYPCEHLRLATVVPGNMLRVRCRRASCRNRQSVGIGSRSHDVRGSRAGRRSSSGVSLSGRACPGVGRCRPRERWKQGRNSQK